MFCLWGLRQRTGHKRSWLLRLEEYDKRLKMYLAYVWINRNLHIATGCKNDQKGMCINNTHISYNTSGTAQGGGGSFKNRNPIGEIGCCESRMAEQKH